MRDKVERRAVMIGKYILDTNKTIREVEIALGVTKSTIHKDLKHRLPEIDPDLYDEVSVIMARHKACRHINGGKATHDKFKQMRAAS
jgi:putative DeoR family transcriptional regulator, stage III sporulation protein D